MSSDLMYGEIIMDYYRHPKNYGRLEKPDAAFRDVNPSCGDIVEVHLQIKDGMITDIRFSGKGCAISQAACSMFTELVKEKELEEARKIGKQEVLDMLGIPISMARMKCALLGLKVFKYALYQYLGMHYEDAES